MSLKVDLSQGKGLINESRRKQSKENILTKETVYKFQKQQKSQQRWER